MYVDGIMVHSRTTQKSKRKSYTVEFHDEDTFSFGYVELFITSMAKQYAVIQKFALRRMAEMCAQENDLSDIVFTFGDLQELLVNTETHNLVAVLVDSVVAQVVCIEMHSSSVSYLAPIPNTVECD